MLCLNSLLTGFIELMQQVLLALLCNSHFRGFVINLNNAISIPADGRHDSMHSPLLNCTRMDFHHIFNYKWEMYQKQSCLMMAFPKAFSRQARTMLLYLLFFYISLRLNDSQEILSARSALELTSNHSCVLSS